MAALPATAIALPTTSMFYIPTCPRHSTTQNWQDIAKLYCKLKGVARNVTLQSAILRGVMKWLEETFDEQKKKSLAANCICDDEADDDESRIPFGEDGSEYLMFFLPSRN